MAPKQLFELVAGALPAGFDPRILKEYGKAEWWAENQHLACAYALRKCKLINWEAYLENNPDVRESGADPVLHFLRDGLFEGRKLFVKRGLEEVNADIRPKISVVVANYNNSLWLEHSIGSLMGQTLKDIEIIVVDDASTDDSLSILYKLAALDNRIKIIVHDHNKSLHMVHKTGVARATGHYVMFLDSDDYYMPDACQKAYDAIVKGYDIVTFGVKVQSPGYLWCRANKMSVYLNGGENRVYSGADIADSMFLRSAPGRNIWNKIYDARLAKSAFAEMEDFEIFSAEDVYEIAPLAASARTMLKIPDKLYVYRFGAGKTTTGDESVFAAGILDGIKIAAPLRRYLKKAGMDRYYEPLMDGPSWNACNAFINKIKPEAVTDYFNALVERLGIDEVFKKLTSMGGGDQYEKLAWQFRHYDNKAEKPKEIKKIGILMSRNVAGGILQVARLLVSELVKHGYQVTLFLHFANANDNLFAEPVDIVYLGTTGNIYQEFPDVNGMIEAFRRHPVDVMLCHTAMFRLLLYHLMLLKYLGIKVICFIHEALYYELMFPGDYWNIQKRGAMLGLCDAAVALSRYAELHYRGMGVNATYIPNPVPVPELPGGNLEIVASDNNTVAVIGRFGDKTKNVRDCLKILQAASRHNPSVKMLFIGSFLDKEEEAKFYQLADSLGMRGRIRLTGWKDDPGPCLREAAILLSTAWHEAFPMSIAEAQAAGLPVVMYDLPLALADDNPAIIRVAHGDIKGAAREITALLADRPRLARLSAIARQKMLQFAPDNYIRKIIALLNSFQSQTSMSYYSGQDYAVVMRALAFYAGNLSPWLRK